MATINLSDELLAELREQAREDRAWQDLLAYGRETGDASGYTEEDLPRLVKEWRRERNEG